MIKTIIDGLPRKISFFERITILDNGMIFVSLPNLNNKNLMEIDVFSKEGKYFYKTKIDVGDECEIKIIRFKNDFLYIVYEDEEGEILFTKYKINLPI